MLVLSRRKGQRIKIGDSIEIVVVQIGEDKVRIGISAPSEIPIVRDDVVKSEPKERNFFPDV